MRADGIEIGQLEARKLMNEMKLNSKQLGGCYRSVRPPGTDRLSTAKRAQAGQGHRHRWSDTGRSAENDNVFGRGRQQEPASCRSPGATRLPCLAVYAGASRVCSLVALADSISPCGGAYLSNRDVFRLRSYSIGQLSARKRSFDYCTCAEEVARFARANFSAVVS